MQQELVLKFDKLKSIMKDITLYSDSIDELLQLDKTLSDDNLSKEAMMYLEQNSILPFANSSTDSKAVLSMSNEEFNNYIQMSREGIADKIKTLFSKIKAKISNFFSILAELFSDYTAVTNKQHAQLNELYKTVQTIKSIDAAKAAKFGFNHINLNQYVLDASDVMWKSVDIINLIYDNANMLADANKEKEAEKLYKKITDIIYKWKPSDLQITGVKLYTYSDSEAISDIICPLPKRKSMVYKTLSEAMKVDAAISNLNRIKDVMKEDIRNSAPGITKAFGSNIIALQKSCKNAEDNFLTTYLQNPDSELPFAFYTLYNILNKWTIPCITYYLKTAMQGRRITINMAETVVKCKQD